MAYGQVPEPPRLSTPLYGFYLPRDDRGAVPSRGTQPAAVASWLESVGANRATIVPAAIDDFPMELSSLAKLQVALHEGFHVQVQSPHWAGRDPAGGSRGRASSGPGWPAWDRQPDRTGLPRCYRSTKEVAAAAEAERAALTGMVESLLDGVPTAACRAGAEFLDRRQARYRLMTDVAVARADSTPGTCREAEAVMELEEGTADYASWTQLFELGLVSRAGLMRRYRAVQNDVFYLTGAMQLHAIALMRPEGMADVARRIGRSGSPEEGSITTVFTAVLDTYCGR